MSALLPLSLRLARAGGPRRSWVVGVGTAVATALLLTTAAIPAALYPAGQPVDPVERANVAAVLAFSLLPATVLLLTAGRASSAVRDRRLAALRLLGLTRARTAVLAALENGVLALAGALVGLVAFLAAAPLVDRVVAAGPRWFGAPLSPAPAQAATVVLGVVLVSAGLGAATQHGTTRSPAARRSEASRRDPSPWRVALVVVAVALMATVAAPGPAAALVDEVGVAMLLVGAMSGALAVALTTPLITTWLAEALVRSRPTSALMAGRALQAEPAGPARLVAGVGVAVYLVLAALAVLSAYESTPQYRFALQTIRQGPQKIVVQDAEGPAPLAADSLAPLAGVPGVRAVVPHVDAAVEGWCDVEGEPCVPAVFVGTCADLAQLMVVSGCDDTAAGVIELRNVAGTDNGWRPPRGALDTVSHLPIRFGEDGPTADVRLGEPLVQDSGATQERWVYQSPYNVFVPRTVADAAGAHPDAAEVVADGGLDVQQAVAAAAGTSLTVRPYPLDDYDAVVRVRVVVTTLSAIVVGVGLLSLAVTALDRAAEGRRSIARHLAVGVPARVLRTSQVLQTFLPLAVAITLATALGALMARAFAALAQWPALSDGVQVVLVALASMIGGALVSLTTVPLVRTRLSPELLRRE
ncbi:FtsX-like permease family protein [Cellulomonas sp. SLBN-39]|uniref:FtsX-like permease family protein n=1 Tax=Cellulomonas sp. SLBN-39 TaxID=2768446 RepID=UPI0011549D76|nr:FtsX-like permease family protein [Cellulomonas sp. SLBN-39]TQL01109.1 FtsX-like permease family protein [Cellulomonas sp. SLBN-39]